MLRYLLVIFLFLFKTYSLIAQTVIEMPDYNDVYSKQVGILENGNTDIDYKAFRYNLIESDHFRLVANKKGDLIRLKMELRKQIIKNDYDNIITTSKKILNVDYTDMEAHKALRQSYKILGDSLNSEKHKAIQFGLLRSIVSNGNGKTCEDGWPVIQISEEYFI